MDGREDQPFASPETIDAEIASALQNMSIEARSTVLEEIHGVAPLPPEEGSPESIQDCLRTMAQALEDIPDKPAFEEARTFATSFFHDDDCRLAFLRAESFDPERAAVRMVKKMEQLSRYFGPVALQRRLTLQDLSEEARSLVKDGTLQLLPTRDRTGRMILMRIGSFGAGVSSQTRVCV